jgi:hypothetical protein
MLFFCLYKNIVMINKENPDRENQSPKKEDQQKVDRKIREGAGSNINEPGKDRLEKSDLPDNDNDKNKTSGMGSGQRQDSN